MELSMNPIGRVEAARSKATDDYWGGAESCIVLDSRFEPDALQGLDEFSQVEVVYIFDRVSPAKIVTGARHPRNNPAWPAVGIFAQRGKNRPSRIGTTICRVIGVEGRRLRVSELDAINGTPVLDLKPVMQEFLPREPVRQPAWTRELMREYWSRPT
jgi:tRNA (Thr-GGU) A37 N-methylase